MEERLTMASGEEIAGHLIETEIRLYLYIYGKTIREVFDLVSEPMNTQTITWDRYGAHGSVEGYTHLMSVSEEMGGMISASLKRELQAAP